jgi:hypothetical protein
MAPQATRSSRVHRRDTVGITYATRERSKEVPHMATRKQVQAAKRNVKKAQTAAKRRRTIAHLPKATRQDLGRQAAAARRRGGRAGRSLEDRNRQQLYEEAKRLKIPGRSRMGKWDLIEAIRDAR